MQLEEIAWALPTARLMQQLISPLPNDRHQATKRTAS